MILTNPSLRVRLTWQNIKLEIPSYSGLCNCNNGSRPKKNYVQGTLMWRFGINFTRVVVKQQKEKRHVFTMNSRPRYQNCACACTFAPKAVLNIDTIMEKRQAVALGGKARGDNSYLIILLIWLTVIKQVKENVNPTRSHRNTIGDAEP